MAEEKKNMSMVDDQYQRLIDARNIHYDNLNKWLMSFYVIIGALFVAMQAIHIGDHLHRYFELGIAIAGYIVSIAAFLSCKGYYYWEINWIMLVHDYEEIKITRLEDRTYGVFGNMEANKSIWNPIKGANVSTTKVALVMTSIITVLWGAIIIYFSINLLEWFPDAKIVAKVGTALIVSAFITWLISALCAVILHSNMSPLKDRELKQKEESYMDKLNKRIVKIICISIVAIIAIVGLCVLLSEAFNLFKADTTFYVKVGISLLALATAGIGVYLTYTIQTTIIKVNAKNRGRDEFTQRLQLYTEGLNKVNIDLQLLQDAIKVSRSITNITITSANVLCSQAYMTYYAFQDLISCEFYQTTFAVIKNVEMYHEDISSCLSKISNSAYICMTDVAIANELIGLVNYLNNNSANFHREIYQILYPKQKTMEERIE